MLCCTNSSVRWSEIIIDQSASQTSPWREQFWTMNVLKDQLPNVVHCKETLLQNSPSKEQPCFLVKILIKPVYLFNTWEITFSKKNVPYEYQLVLRTNATVYRNQTSRVDLIGSAVVGYSLIFASPLPHYILYTLRQLTGKASYSISICS